MTLDEMARFLSEHSYELAHECAAEFYAETERIERERAEFARRKREREQTRPGKRA